MNYDADYFIDMFKSIPASNWTIASVYDYAGRRCALGHCLMYCYFENGKHVFQETRQSYALRKLLRDVEEINDGAHQKYRQNTPKNRILAALGDIKKGVYEIQ